MCYSIEFDEKDYKREGTTIHHPVRFFLCFVNEIANELWIRNYLKYDRKTAV